MKIAAIFFLGVVSQVYADSYQVPSAVSCQGKSYNLSIENMRSKPGEISDEYSPNMVELVDLSTGKILEKSQLKAGYNPSTKIYSYYDFSNKRVMTLKTGIFGRRAKVTYIQSDFTEVNFSGCRVYMTHPSPESW